MKVIQYFVLLVLLFLELVFIFPMGDSSESLRRPKLLLDSEVTTAQQLMHVSESDNNKSEKSKEESTYLAIIEEIFGKEDEILYRPKKRRYRSLDSLYRATKPVPAV